MQLFQKILAIQRIVYNLVVVFGGLLVFVKEEVFALRLAPINNIVLKLLLVHVCLLVLEVILLIPILVIF